MTRRVSLVQIYACLAFVVAIVAADQDECDKKKCPGPLEYYKQLDCKPVYEKEGDCCATRYNCDHLKERSKDKCYVNGKEYEIGEKLKDEDANPCDIGCSCIRGYDDIATFICAAVDCFYSPTQPGCFKRSNLSQCCSNTEDICPDKLEDRATCVVDGKTYRDGEYFEVDEPELNCVCQPGYEGKNVEPFCMKYNRPTCSPDFRNAADIHQNCAPVFYSDQPPQTSCSLSTRCQNANDTVIAKHGDLKSSEEPADEQDMCLFGDLKMRRHDELNQDTDYSSTCVKCVCEVPPVPTCQRLPYDECDVTKHSPILPL